MSWSLRTVAQGYLDVTVSKLDGIFLHPRELTLRQPRIIPHGLKCLGTMVQLTRNSLVPESLILRPMAPPPPHAPERSLEACASTASLFLYAQGSTILCLHHDTLALDRRFEDHQDDIAFISVDNVSERGQGRLVVSYDVGQTAIVWDLFTGTEIARFAAFEPLKVASWMRNGNVAFGIFFFVWVGVTVLTRCREYERRGYPFRAVDFGACLY